MLLQSIVLCTYCVLLCSLCVLLCVLLRSLLVTTHICWLQANVFVKQASRITRSGMAANFQQLHTPKPFFVVPWQPLTLQITHPPHN
jgi:hypothetical protein